MLRTVTKERILQQLNTMQKCHEKLLVAGNVNELITTLQNLQESAIAIGGEIEAAVTHEQEMIALLETYCEEIFLLSQNPDILQERLVFFNELIDKVYRLVEERHSVYQVVFMPYNASMWDSLESIYKACSIDERCECLVVPIPYFHFEADKKEWTYCYEGERFPSELHILDYREYQLELEHPDVIYIHNPYDNCNHVTSVHPSYYSSELKKSTGKLIYVPYYVTSGHVSEEHLQLPVYYNMDYMIAQSENYKEAFKEMPFYDKIQPFGSPKLDRVIHMSNQQIKLPEEWKICIGNRKCMMLNTSINCFLTDGSLYIKKLRYVFEKIKEDRRVALIWRPHPLLESTIASMRPHLMQEYSELVEYFKNENIGVFDTTPDITFTVAVTDAYIGDEGTSVINLFAAAGKPVFILNNLIYMEFTDTEKRSIAISDMIKDGNAWWILAAGYNGLFKVDGDWSQIQFVGRVDGQPKWFSEYAFLTKEGDELYLSPNMASVPVKYHIKNNVFQELAVENEDESLLCRNAVVFENKIFYIPLRNGKILEYNQEKNEWKEHQECIQQVKCNRNVGVEPDSMGYAVEKQYLYVIFSYTNCVLRFNMLDGQYEILIIGKNEYSYSGIALDEKYIWLAETHSGDIVCYDRQNEKYTVYAMPEEFRCWKGLGNRECAHRGILNMGDFLVTVPGFSNAMILLNKKNGETKTIAPQFWSKSEQIGNEYHPEKYFSAGAAAKASGKTIVVQRMYDRAIAEIDITTQQYDIYQPTLEESAYARFTENEDGFEKIGKYYGFLCRENRIFSLENFIHRLAEGMLEDIKPRQKVALSTMAANLDGSCGEKVHEFVMERLIEG